MGSQGVRHDLATEQQQSIEWNDKSAIADGWTGRNRMSKKWWGGAGWESNDLEALPYRDPGDYSCIDLTMHNWPKSEYLV